MKSTNKDLTTKSNLSTSSQRVRFRKVVRTFSSELKIKKVKLYDQGLINVSELSRELEVSRSAIYKWIHKYSLNYDSPTRLVMESKSEAKKVQLLKEELKAVQSSLGKKQMQLDFLNELLELASDHYGEDIAKKFSPDPIDVLGTKKGKKN